MRAFPGSRSRCRFRGFFSFKPVNVFHHNEYGKGHDQEADYGVEKEAVVQRHCSGRLSIRKGGKRSYLGSLLKNNKEVAEIDKGGHVFVKAEAVPGYVKVSVVDDGLGIPAKDLPRVFERFFQVESHLTRRHGGMGLGLSVAKVMIEMHGGRIWVESVEGKGSNFTFLLPVDPMQASAADKVFLS